MAVAETTVAKTVIASPAEFDETVGALTGDVFLLFYGERKEDGDSWCPDCTAAYPIVEGALKARSAPSTLVEVVVKRDEYKGKPDYAYKVHPKVGLQAIPQLVKWQGGESVGALVEEDVAVPEKVASLVA